MVMCTTTTATETLHIHFHRELSRAPARALVMHYAAGNPFRSQKSASLTALVYDYASTFRGWSRIFLTGFYMSPRVSVWCISRDALARPFARGPANPCKRPSKASA